ncbi:hypothetical protein [Pseudooctadecabacter jejudonensis]|uniref:PH domain-containing protein n=1 Tax=Pseudooctadecabacter jejudonensis TaxID=1391910 RepID=A0A1Y5T7M3_9RHOB|nr:hypothetical protein [Pseudooctadecabacter jejudonensis]SLN55648.1 hypothetical protein PSJ8397_02933 [Pseudooctadecabacter jejudonensis]
MRVVHNTPDRLVINGLRWKRALVFALLTLGALWVGWHITTLPDGTIGWLLLWLLLTVSWLLPLALFAAERSQLVLDAPSNTATLVHRSVMGLHRNTWPLAEVQSTRVLRHRPRGPADEDPKRHITLYVRQGMDKGRHRLSNHLMPTQDAIAVSTTVSDWMRNWRALDSAASAP